MGGTACRAETLKGYDGEIVQDGAKYLHSPVHAGISKCDIYIYDTYELYDKYSCSCSFLNLLCADDIGSH